MKVVVLAPWRPGSEERQALWDFARRWWAEQFPAWDVFEAPGPLDGPFNRSAAINQAAALAGDWDVAVIIDTDTIPETRNIASGAQVAAATGQMVVAHTRRHMLSKAATPKVLGGYRGSWSDRGMVEKTWHDSVSCAVLVSRKLWDTVGGFDEKFVGWGYEDTAFRIACETLTGAPIITLDGDTFHLWHPISPEANRNTPTYKANGVRVQRYRDARWRPDDLQVLLDEARQVVAGEPLPETRIPRILHRTVPADTSDEVEAWWRKFQVMHPGWEFRTYREPIDPADWPLTGDLWGRCQNGAQKAGLIRLEALYHHGGVYVDSDVEPFRSLEPLLRLEAFAAWEDETTVPDAVLGAMPEHPAFRELIDKARACIEGGGDAWHSGPGVCTETLPTRPDVLVLPPGSFYPHHYLEKSAAGARTGAPWVFVEHKWHHSWGDPASKASIARRQR